MHLAYLLTYCFNFRFLLNILCKWQTILSKQVLWTEAAFSACLVWHWPHYHWQCNWQVAWTSSRTCTCKRRTLWVTIVTIIQQYDEMFQFLSNLTLSLDCFLWKLPQIRTSNLYKVVPIYWRCGGKYYVGFVENLLLFPGVKEFRKSVKNWRSYRHEFGVLLFGDTVYVFFIILMIYNTEHLLYLKIS